MRTVLFCLVAGGLSLGLVASGSAATAVGQSSLIETLDYSDTWTTTANGGIAGRSDGAFPVNSPGINMEQSYGNTARSWPNSLWSIRTDTNAAGAYPGGSGAGSASGMTRTTGGGDFHWGFQYNLRRDFIVQWDATVADDRVDIGIGGNPGTIGTSNLTVFLRAAGVGYPEIGVYNGTVETNTGFTSGLSNSETGKWHNFAVHFDLPAGKLTYYVDQVKRGTTDLRNSPYAAFTNAATANDYVTIGCRNLGGVSWGDNFQVGRGKQKGTVVLTYGQITYPRSWLQTKRPWFPLSPFMPETRFGMTGRALEAITGSGVIRDNRPLANEWSRSLHPYLLALAVKQRFMCIRGFKPG